MPRKKLQGEGQLNLNFEYISAENLSQEIADVCQQSAEVFDFSSYARSKAMSSKADPVIDRLLQEARRLSW